MSFIPVVERPMLGKKMLPSKSHADMLYHQDQITNNAAHTGKKILGIAKPFRLEDHLSRGGVHAVVDNSELYQPPRRVAAPIEEPQRPPRSKSSMEKIEYKPLGAKSDASASKFTSLKSSLASFVGFDSGSSTRPGLRLAPLSSPPPPECEIPGFHGMGNPFLVVPNERPNQVAATKTNAMLGRNIPFMGERKNNIWSVYSE